MGSTFLPAEEPGLAAQRCCSQTYCSPTRGSPVPSVPRAARPGRGNRARPESTTFWLRKATWGCDPLSVGVRFWFPVLPQQAGVGLPVQLCFSQAYFRCVCSLTVLILFHLL